MLLYYESNAIMIFNTLFIQLIDYFVFCKYQKSLRYKVNKSGVKSIKLKTDLSRVYWWHKIRSHLWKSDVAMREMHRNLNLHMSTPELCWQRVIILPEHTNRISSPATVFISPSDICKPLRAVFRSCGSRPPAGSCWWEEEAGLLLRRSERMMVQVEEGFPPALVVWTVC